MSADRLFGGSENMAELRYRMPGCMWAKDGYNADPDVFERGRPCGADAAFKICGDDVVDFYLCGHHAKIAEAQNFQIASLGSSDLRSSRDKESE